MRTYTDHRVTSDPGAFRVLREDIGIIAPPPSVLGNTTSSLPGLVGHLGSTKGRVPHPWSAARNERLATAVRAMTTLTRIDGVGEAYASSLREHGYTSLIDIAVASPDDLMAISGIGPVRARLIHESAIDLLEAATERYLEAA